MRRFLLRIAVYCGMALLPVLTGCGIDQRVEQIVEDRAQTLIGPAQNYDATVEGVSQNRINHLHLVGTDVRPRQGPVIEHLVIDMNDTRYRRDPFQLQSVGNTAFTARVTESALNTYLQNQATPRIRNPQITFQQDLARLAGTVTTSLGDLQATSTGRFVPHGAQIDYQPQTLEVGGVEASAALRNEIADRINPVADLSNQQFTPDIRDICITPGAVTLSGTAIVTDGG